MSSIERKLIGAAVSDLQQMYKMIENIAASVLTLRPVVASALLGLSRLEAIRVEQSSVDLQRDTLLALAENRLIEVTAKAALELGEKTALIEQLALQVNELNDQVERIVETKEERPDYDDDMPDDGETYVGINYILSSSGMSKATYKRKVASGEFPPHEAESNVKGNMLKMWKKSTVEPICDDYRDASMGK